MSIPLIVDGQTFTYPTVGDVDWGLQATAWADAVTNTLLPKAGGLYQLSGEIDFGSLAGLKALWFNSRTPNAALSGVVRLAYTDTIGWRNSTNTGNLLLGVNSSDKLTLNGVEVGAGIGTVTSVGITSTDLLVTNSPITTSGNINLDLANTAVTPGTYTNATITVDAKGRLTAATSGIAGGVTSFNTRTGAVTLNSTDISTALNLTGYLKGNGLGAITASSTIPTSALSGTIDLLTQTSGNLPVARLNSGLGASASTYWRGDGTWASPGAAAAAGPNKAVQYNNGGAFGGNSSFTYDTSTNRLYVGPIVGAGGTAAGRIDFGAANLNTVKIDGYSLDGVQSYLELWVTDATASETANLTLTAGPAANPSSFNVPKGLVISGPYFDFGSSTKLKFASSFGTAGQVLTINGSGYPTWQASSTGTVTSVGFSSTDLAVSGSPITTAGTIIANLTSTGVVAGSYTNANLTIDAKGRITAASNGTVSSGTVTSIDIAGSNGVSSSGGPITSSGTITIGLGNITPTSVAATGTVTGSNLSGTNTGDQTITLTGDVTGSGTGSFVATLANTSVVPGSYTNADLTVDSKGRITAISNGASGGVTSFNTRTGAVTLTSSDVTTALGYTPSSLTPAGSNYQIQYKNGGSLAAASWFAVDGGGSPILYVGNNVGSGSTNGVIRLGQSGTSNVNIESTINPASNVALDISANNATSGKTSYISLNADTSSTIYGGSGLNLSSPSIGISTTGPLSVNGLTGSAGQVLTSNGPSAAPSWTTVSGGSGTVTSVDITGSNGVTASGGPITSSGSITVGLGNITPTSVAATGTVTGSNLSGTNTGDQTITLTGDVTGSGTGSFAATLANTTVTAGSYTNANITVDSKGRITSASNGAGGVTSVSGTAGNISSTGGSTPVLDLVATAVTPGSYTNANLTVDAYGRITAAANGSSSGAVWGSITGTLSSQTDLNTALNLKLNVGNPVATGTFQVNGSGGGALAVAPGSNYALFTGVDGSAAYFAVNGFLSTAASAPAFTTYRARGTSAAPSGVLSGDWLGRINFQGYDTSAPVTGAFIIAAASVDWTPTNHQSRLAFVTVGASSTSNVTRLRIENDGTATNYSFDPSAAMASNFLLNGTLSFKNISNTTTYATLNLATGAAASTDLLRLSDVTTNATKGGTGQTSYAVGDLLYASSTTALSRLAAGTNGYVLTLAGGVPTWAAPTGGGSGTVTSVTVDGTAGRITSSGSPITTTGTITLDLATTAVTPGSYTNANLTVDAYGRITAAANGTAGLVAPNYEEATATASQTVFNTTVNTQANGSGKTYLVIFVNGVKQREGATKAYTVTGANQVTFNSGLASGDEVEFMSFV